MLVTGFTVILVGFVAVAKATTYAQFCDDTFCTVNCGESVSVDNPGCLNESGRQGVMFHDTNVQQVSLVFSPSPDCPCQNDCYPSLLYGTSLQYSGPPCIDLNNYAPAQSFRFIGGDSCDPNNC